MLGIINKDDKILLKKVKKANIDEVKLWRIPNIVIPSFIIISTILVYVFFQPSQTVTIEGGLNFLVNGSIPLIAVNQIAGIGIYIFKFNKTKEFELGIETTKRIRTALFYRVFCLLFLCALLYSYQTIHHPFDSVIEIIIIAIISILFLCFSSHISHNIFILQDEFITLAYDEGIRETVNETLSSQSWDEYDSNE